MSLCSNFHYFNFKFTQKRIAIHKALFENGIVVAGSGAGIIHEAQKKVLKELLTKGLKSL
ncbi:hypothetical protein [Campylobacter upsaliensis]|uniref:hypothetical protein n=1 Tax=Campylobacter upsaliensis TaxID=28080 RepID=UPI00399D7443